MRAMRLGFCAVASLVAVGCQPSPPPEVRPAAAAATQPKTRQMPRSQASLPTTDPSIAVANFLGLYDAVKKTPGEAAQRVSLLSTHAQYFGALDDYDAALATAERVAKAHPNVPEALTQRAGARGSLHQFAGALADLERAQALGFDRDSIDSARAGVLTALGRYDEALPLRERIKNKRATTATLAALAQLKGEMGDVAAAEAGFIAAQDAFEDVSPFTLAWLYFQAGLVEERAGRPSAARELYEAAHERLPQYAPAAGHLASAVALAGDDKRAQALLEPLVEASDDPEYRAQLGALLQKRGGNDAVRGRLLVAEAGKRYDELVRRHADAFADHAARFWLGAGDDAGKALALARRNLSARPTRDAYELALRAALAAKEPAVACRLADEATRIKYATASLHLAMSDAYGACTRGERAALELKAATVQQ